jgi:hypothetical protein
VSAGGLGSLTRGRLPGRTLLRLKRGGLLRPDVLLAESGAGPVVVKDWSGQPRLLRRAFGRLLLRREARAHRRLAGLRQVPRLLGCLDAYALVLEYRAGTRIGSGRPWLFDARFAAALERALAEIHARGVIHLDLAHRGNLGADAGGRPLVLDLGAALCVRQDAASRALQRALAVVDRRALRKWRRRLAGAVAATSQLAGSAGPPGAGGGADSEGGRAASRPT